MIEFGSDSVLLAAVTWLQRTLLGTLATTIAIIAVAAVGFSALSGRMPLRRGLTVIAGCFILFGAGSIAAGIRALANDGEGSESADWGNIPTATPLPLGPAALPSPSAPLAPYDPYSGASLPSG